jgi:hypothetical protein
MEYKLSLNRHKGDREGWSGDSPELLLARLKEEVTELLGAIHSGTDQQVLEEAADVANFAMMIADVSGGLQPHIDCGKGWLSPDEARKNMHALEAEVIMLRACNDQLVAGEQAIRITANCLRQENSHYREKVKRLEEALKLLLNSVLAVPYLHDMPTCVCSNCTAIRTAKQALETEVK